MYGSVVSLSLTHNAPRIHPNHSQFAAEHDAVETLLMSDSIFRVRDFVARRKYVDLVESVSRLSDARTDVCFGGNVRH